MHLQRLTNFRTRFISACIFTLIFWGIALFLPPIFLSISLGIILGIILLFEWKSFFSPQSWLFWIIMPLYPILPFVLLIFMNNNPVHHDLVLILFTMIFSFDTGSYLVGSLYGKIKIYPRISPNKTWEGFFGGYVCCIASLLLIIWELGASFHIYFIMIFSATVCILALMGDLFESWLKRHAHIKDSGTLMPGHGGFLDRFDAIAFTAPLFYMCKTYLIYFFRA